MKKNLRGSFFCVVDCTKAIHNRPIRDEVVGKEKSIVKYLAQFYFISFIDVRNEGNTNKNLSFLSSIYYTRKYI